MTGSSEKFSKSDSWVPNYPRRVLAPLLTLLLNPPVKLLAKVKYSDGSDQRHCASDQGRPVNVKHGTRCVMSKDGGDKTPKREDFNLLLQKILHNGFVIICDLSGLVPGIT